MSSLQMDYFIDCIYNCSKFRIMARFGLDYLSSDQIS